MSRRIRILVMLAVTTVVATNAAVAWAYFTKAGTGTAPATVGTLSAPSSVGVPASPATSTIHVTWNGVTAPTGPTVGYWVQRYSGTTPTDACGSSKSSPIASGTGAKNCDDTGVNPGTYTYTVTSVWRSWTAQSSPSSSVTVAGLDHFAVAAPASTTAGSSFSLTITAQDASNNTFSGYRGAIHFASSDGQAGLPSNYTFTATDNGVRTFTNLTTLKTAGSQTITTNDTAQTTKTGTATVTVSPASLDHFTVTNPGTQTAGTAFTATIRALDLYNNAANGWTATTQCVTFSGPTSSPDGTAPTYPAAGSCGTGSSNLTFDSSGQATATVTLRSAGSTTLTVTGSTKSGTSTSFTVNAAGAARLAWTNVTKSAGTLSNPCLFTCTDTALANFGTFSANVSVTDNFGNIVSGLGTGHTVTVSTPTSGAGSGGAFTAPTAGTSVTLTTSSSGAASSTVQFTFKAQNGSWSSDTFTAQTASGTSYTSATATVTKS